MNIPRSSSNRTIICDCLIAKGVVIELQFYHFPDSDRLRGETSQTK